MFTGVSYKAAIDYWKKGREVIVIDRNSQNDSGGYDNFPFEELFRNVEFLADVPAVENPEFRQAVEDMIHGSDQNTMDEDKNGISAQAAKIAKELKDSVEGEVLPPPLTRPEKKEPPAGKSKKEVALELYAKGMPVREIADQVGAKYNTVYYWTHAKLQKKTGWNEDRHACKTCQYRADGASRGCDYYVLTDRERGCDPADCDKYIKGERLKNEK